MALKLKLEIGSEALKEYSETVSLGDYSAYRNSLKVLQKNVNEYLTGLVENESEHTQTASDPEESDCEEASSKRALSSDRELHRPKAHKKAKEQ